jgi:hypothetical protein
MLLRRTLQANGFFSGLSGILLIADAGPLASFLGLASALPLVVIGAVLLLHAAILLVKANREPVDPRLAWYAIIGDVAWVIGSVEILVTGWLPLTPAGWWAVAIVADIVAVFAILQFYELRRQQG